MDNLDHWYKEYCHQYPLRRICCIQQGGHLQEVVDKLQLFLMAGDVFESDIDIFVLDILELLILDFLESMILYFAELSDVLDSSLLDSENVFGMKQIVGCLIELEL